MKFNAFIYLFFILLKFSYSTISEQCTKSMSFWNSLKYPYLNVLPTLKLPSETASIKCAPLTTNTCCNSDSLKEMVGMSEIKLKELYENKIEFLLTMFSNDSFILMNMFLNDLENTKNDLNKLFSKTYGYNYKVHKVFFYSWFEKLKSYMEGKLHNISQLLDDFFLEMAEKIVKILIPADSGSEMTKCHTARLIEAKPYQDTDIGLKNKIVRSYPPARLFVNAIAVGRDVFKKLLQKTAPLSNCYEKFNSVFHCMLCNGLTIKSCPVSCNEVVENCFGSIKLSDLKRIDKVLNKYIKSIIALASRLDNPFNFPIVNHKMNVQISTAIMNVQNIYPNVKEQIKAKCQKSEGLKKIRRKRQASKEFYRWQNVNSNSQKQWWEKNLAENMDPNAQKPLSSDYSTKPNDFLSPIAKSIKIKYKALEKYFIKISSGFCKVNEASSESLQCWNGTAAIRPEVSLEKNSKKKLEKSVDANIKTYINQLQEITKRMNDYLSETSKDPETLRVEEYILHAPKPDITQVSKFQKSSKSPQVFEGSGDSEKLPLNEPILTNNKEPVTIEPVPVTIPPKKIEEPPKIDTASKPEKNWQFPSWAEGSGDNEIKKPVVVENKTPKPISWPEKKIEKKTTTKILNKSSTASSVKIITDTTIKPNQIPDDEDLNPEDLPPKVNSPVLTTTAIPVIIPEGSGSDPDLSRPKVKQPNIISVAITTKKPILPFKEVEGSGSDIDPKPDSENNRPVLPMLPESTGKVTTQSTKIKKPGWNPDEEPSPVEGSGKSPINPPMVSKPQTFTESTMIPTKPFQPDQYPGKIPSEVWIPRVEKPSEKDSQRTTTSSQSNENHRFPTVIMTTLSLLLTYYCLP